MLYANGLSLPLQQSVKLTASELTEVLNSSNIILYQSIIGKLIYAMIATRLDLAFTVSLLGQFNAAPSKIHLEAAKKTIRYLKQTTTVGITYSANSLQELRGFCDSDWARDLDSWRFTSSYVFCLSGGAISWKSKRQQTVALSSTEAKY